MGQMRNRFGLLNPIHEHDRPFIDNPNVLRGSSATRAWSSAASERPGCAPLPFFLEVLVGVFNGENEDAFGRGRARTAAR